MSHLKERKEKVCLNCNAELSGPFCHICGQENIEPKESAWHLVTHFFNDITHFDGKFFSTLRLLLFRPGFLATEYARGRRASYLNPVRMYVFTSAAFFLIFFSYMQSGENEGALVKNDIITADSVMVILQKKEARLSKKLNSVKDSTTAIKLKRTLAEIHSDIELLKADSANIDHLKTYDNDYRVLGFWSDEYTGTKHYDSVQHALPAGKKDGYFMRNLKRKTFKLNEDLKIDREGTVRKLEEKFIHHFPQMLFVSLPFYALLLKLLYWRRKEFYYVSHAIFGLQYYIFFFITMLVTFAITKLSELPHMGFLSFVNSIITIALFFYQYKAMRNFYGQRRFKTIIKFIALLLMSLLVVMILFVFFITYSLFEI